MQRLPELPACSSSVNYEGSEFKGLAKRKRSRREREREEGRKKGKIVSYKLQQWKQKQRQS